MEFVRSCVNIVREMHSLNHLSRSRNSQGAFCVHSGAVGRPKYEISEPHLMFLLENRFSVPQIAAMIAEFQLVL